MKVLISPVSLEEARIVADGGADIVDIKNTNEGSLGANFPWIIQSVVKELSNRDIIFSATIGDLPYKPGTAALAALGAASAGARYVKAGLYGTRTMTEAIEVMTAVSRACKMHKSSITVVAAGYADYRRFGGLDPESLIIAACESDSNVVMLDTAIKDGSGLFDNMSLNEVRSFVRSGHRNGMDVALAGSLGIAHLEDLKLSGADIIGVRGAVCDEGDRSNGITVDRVREFMKLVRGN